MKTPFQWSRALLLWLAAAGVLHLLAPALFAQGKVQFLNSGTTLLFTNTAGDGVSGIGGVTTSAGQYTIGLYVAPAGTTDPNAFVLMRPTTTNQSGLANGRFNGGSQFVISNNTGQPIAFQVRAWHTYAGPTYDEARYVYRSIRYLGVSAIGQVTPATTIDQPVPGLFGTSPGQVGGFTLTPGGFFGPPVVSITAPTNGSLVSAPASILVAVSAYQLDNNLIFVKLFTNGVVAEQKSSPFLNSSFTLSNLTAGHYTLWAVAAGGSGHSTTSAPVILRVADRPVLEFTRGSNGPIQFQFNSATGINYVVESGTLTNFSPVITNAGTASPISYSETNSSAPQRTYRVRLQ